MDDRLVGLIAYAVCLSPAGIAFVWSKRTDILTVRKILTLTVAIIFVGVSILFTVGASVGALCDGNQLNGYGNCHIISTRMANRFLSALLLVTPLAVWTLGAFISCGFLEFRKFKRR